MLQTSTSYYIHKLIPGNPSLSFIKKKFCSKSPRCLKSSRLMVLEIISAEQVQQRQIFANIFVDERAEQQRLEELVYSVNNTCNSRIGVVNQLLQKTDSNFYDYKVAANRSMHTFELNLQTVREDLDSVSNYYGI